MGRMVTKAPRRVRQYGEHMVGYVKSTLEMSLAYGKCPGPEEDGALAFPRSMQRLEIHSDASFAPAGGKGHQGLVAMYGGVPVQWESKQQSFGTLSTAESELLGYTDGLTLGESVAAVVELLEPGGIMDKVLYGDNEAGLRLIQSPDGPWRTRHLRLRAFVLKERVALEIWRARHVPGAQLTADHLTKAVVSAASWQRFRRWMSLILPEEVKAGDQGNGAENAGSFSKITAAVVGTMAALGMMVAAPSTSKIAKVAGAVGFAALAAWMTQHKGPMGHKNAAKEDPIRARQKTIGPSRAADPRVGAPEWWAVERRCSREDEPEPVGKDVRENEPTSTMGARDYEPATIHCSPWGSPEHPPRLCAVRAGQTFGPQPWEAPEFGQPPHRGPDDLWLQISGGWVVRVHRQPRSRLFHPIHRSCPVEASDLEDKRISVIWFSGSRGWQRVVQEDTWQRGQVPPAAPVAGTWIGWTFFRLREWLQDGRSSAAQPRIQPDTVIWSPTEGSAWNMARQFGVSTGATRRGYPSDSERGSAAMASINTSRFGSGAPMSGTSDGSWSVAGSGTGLVPKAAAWRPSSNQPPWGPESNPPSWRPESNPPSWRPTSSSSSSLPSSSMASSPMGNPGGAASSSRPTRPMGYAGGIPPGSVVVAKTGATRPTRWSEGPTLSIREGETERMATLRVLGAPMPPDLGRREEDPEHRRQRYLQSSRAEVSDEELWCFVHGENFRPARSEYDEAVESEEDSNGDFSLVTEQVEESPRNSDPDVDPQVHEDEAADM